MSESRRRSRRGLEASRWAWATLLLMAAAALLATLGPFGILPAGLLLGLVLALALEATREGESEAERFWTRATYLLLASPILLAVVILAWVRIQGVEVSLGGEELEVALWIAASPAAVGLLNATWFVTARRGTRRDLVLLLVAGLFALPIALLWAWLVEGPFVNVPGTVFSYLGGGLYLLVVLRRIYWPVHEPQAKRSLALYEQPAAR